MQTANKLSVIGIGFRPLNEQAKKLVLSSDVILASGRLAEVFRGYDDYAAVRGRMVVINNIDQTLRTLKEEVEKKRAVVLLASGDPEFFGISRRVLEEFGKDAVELFPDLSCIQAAFARIKEPWDDALLISLHGGPDPAKRRRLPYEVGDIPSLLEAHPKIAILTDNRNNPAEIAKALDTEPATPKDGVIMYVCERLGYADEKSTKGAPHELAVKSFSDPNVVIVMKQGPGSGVQGPEDIRFGLREDEIQHERGLITKDEARAAALHKLRLPHNGVFWDLGAGSGSVSLEAARLCPELKVLAVEMNEERVAILKSNVRKFNIRNIGVLCGAAPETLTALPNPDRVFIGGSGGKLDEIVQAVADKMSSGIIVINAVSIDTLIDAVSSLGKSKFTVEVSEISVSRSKVVGGKMLFSAQNPIFIVRGVRG